jgi:hypothetical protein
VSGFREGIFKSLSEGAAGRAPAASPRAMRMPEAANLFENTTIEANLISPPKSQRNIKI